MLLRWGFMSGNYSLSKAAYSMLIPGTLLLLLPILLFSCSGDEPAAPLSGTESALAESGSGGENPSPAPGTEGDTTNDNTGDSVTGDPAANALSQEGETPAVDPRFEYYARNADLELREVYYPRMEGLGFLLVDKLIDSRLGALIASMQELSYWQNFDFSFYGLEEFPPDPWRQHWLSMPIQISGNSWEMKVLLISFNTAHMLQLVIYSENTGIRIESIRIVPSMDAFMDEGGESPE